uniref:TIGR04222 domain-containing membrane protein n=1 Tax=Trichocoleus desertorum TaxID=1481672 RepID=UPI0025B2E7C8|nr:TIGR04222 domain-containing membrane protein [Trichocoleus desertorum]
MPVVGLASLLRWLLRYPNQGAVTSSDLDLYEVAFLAAGRKRAVEAAIVHLVQQRYLQPKSKIQALSVTKPLPQGSHPLEEAVATAARAKGSVHHVRGAVTDVAEEIGDRLREKGLLLPYWRAFLGQWVPALLVIALLLLGISKISVGLERHKPVGFLMILCLFTGFAAIRCLIPVRLSRYGQKVLQNLLQEKASLKQVALNGGVEHSSVGLAFALFGTASLSGKSFADLRFALGHSISSSSSGFDGGGGCGSGCGGSSGCGSSGCGGGCGGCGG